MAADWDRPHSREIGAFQLTNRKQMKYGPPIGRVDNVYGDRNLFCFVFRSVTMGEKGTTPGCDTPVVDSFRHLLHS